MADKNDESRDQKPTARKLREARRKGQVAQSRELTGALALAVGALVLVVMLPGLSVQLSGLFSIVWGSSAQVQSLSLGATVYQAFWLLVVATLTVVAAVMVTAIVVSRLQTGSIFSIEPVKAKLERVSPVTNLKNILSIKSVVMLALMVFKSAVIGLGIWVVFSAYFGDAIRMVLGGAGAAIAVSGGAITSLLMWGVVGFILMAGLDFAFQRFNYQREMKMSRREIKREVKEDEGDPIIKSARRQSGQEIGINDQLQYIDRASIILCDHKGRTIVMIYLPDQQAKPIVVLKAAGSLAQRVIGMGQQHGRPVVYESAQLDELWPYARASFTVPDQFAAPMIKLIEQAA